MIYLHRRQFTKILLILNLGCPVLDLLRIHYSGITDAVFSSRMILHPEDESIKMINTIDEKAEMLEELGIDHLIITPFSRDFSNPSAEEYIRDVLVNKIGTKKNQKHLSPGF